jgi:RecA/RadA recombinase
MAKLKKEKLIVDSSTEDMEQIIKGLGNDSAQSVDKGLYGNVDEYIDTGSYTFNAVLSGTLFGGFPFSRVTAFAGEEGTGKTFYVLDILKNFFKQNPKGFVFYFESENSLDDNLFLSRGIDPKRVFVIPVNTIEDFKTQALKACNSYMELDKAKRPKVMYILDSLGMLSTMKEQADSLEGKHVRDMTRAQVIRGAFRTLTLNLGIAGIPMILTNHTYAVVGSYFPTKEMSGGGGTKYAASSIIFLAKKKDKDDKTKRVRGAIITATVKKGRLSRENSQVETRLFYDSGLDRYYGLLPLAEESGVFKKVSTRYEMPDGTLAFENAILAEPKKYFTQEVLEAIDVYVKKEFQYHYTLDVEPELDEAEEELMLTPEEMGGQEPRHPVLRMVDLIKETTILDDDRPLGAPFHDN